MVGRILYLKNNHIPPFDANIKSDYISFGNYDGISISNNIFKDKGNSLINIWLKSIEDTITMDGGYSSQAMYLFNDDIADEEFWKDDCFQFLFLIVLQLNKRDDNLGLVCNKIKQKICDYCKKNKFNIKIKTYLMLDENDVLLAIKCNNYKLGKIVASSFHKENNVIFINDKTFYISYSFTITGIKKTMKDYNQCEVPDYCEIQLIERYPGSAHKLEMKTEEIYPIFGRDDHLIRFRCNSWNDILDLYSENGHFYNNSSYRENFLSVSTQFLCKIDKNEEIIFDEGNIEQQGNSEKTISSQLRDKIKILYQSKISELVDENANYNNALLYNSCACFKAIWQILNSIEKFEYRVFPDYIYISVFAPLYMLISKISKENKLNSIDGIYSLLTAINQISQNLIRAERQFMQIPELNANCYNVPIKLHLYYAAFVEQVKNYLNCNFGTGNFYEFALYPGINEQLKVTRVFYPSPDNNRILLMKIPEKQVFDPEHMMICLCHEVGHFVGSKLRQREERYNALKMAISRMICLHIYCDKEIRNYITKDGLDYLLKYQQEEIIGYIEKHKKMVERNSQNYSDTIVHSENLKPVFINGLSAFILDNIAKKNQIFDAVLNEYMKKQNFNECNVNYFHGYIKYLKEDYNNAIYNFFCKIHSNDSNEHNITIYNMVKRLFSLSKESFADLVSVLILELDFKTYCKSIIKSFTDYETKEIINSDITIRIILVTMAMSLPLEDHETKIIYDAKWKKNQISEWEQEEKDTNIKNFLRVILNYYDYALYSYENGDSAYERLANIQATSVISVFRDYELLSYLYFNLANSRLYFEKKSNDNSEKERVKIKQNFEILTNELTICEKVIHINHVNCEYDNFTRKRIQEALKLQD